ncbi:hypothetical protein PR048_016545, partial [Dryococelus australis]
MRREMLTAFYFDNVSAKTYVGYSLTNRIHIYICASPDGLVEDQGMVEIKSPFSAARMDGEKFLETNESQTITVKKTHEYYYQIQGLLHITQRDYCIFCRREAKQAALPRFRLVLCQSVAALSGRECFCHHVCSENVSFVPPLSGFSHFLRGHVTVVSKELPCLQAAETRRAGSYARRSIPGAAYGVRIINRKLRVGRKKRRPMGVARTSPPPPPKRFTIHSGDEAWSEFITVQRVPDDYLSNHQNLHS